MNFHGVVTLLNAATSVAAGEGLQFPTGTKTFQVSGRTEAGAGAATVAIAGSLDGENWDSLLLSPVSLTLGTTSTSDSFTSDDRYTYHRAEVTGISGTGASVTVLMGY